MSTYEQEIVYRCDNDCKFEGCPSHTMRVMVQTTADVMSITPDTKDPECVFGFDRNLWDALKKVLKGWGGSGFDLS